MKSEYKKLKKIIEKANNILILTHKGPDFDAFCSALILKRYLNIKYPKKIISFKTRKSPTQNIPYMDQINIVEDIKYENEDLVILTDSSGLKMCLTEKDRFEISKNTKIVVLDHHDTKDGNANLIINNNMSSATEQVLDFCINTKGRKFKINKEISILGQIGIIVDTGRFLFENTTPETYELMSKLRKIYELDIEEFEYKNGKLPIESVIPINIYLKNINTINDMAYTYISNDDISKNKLSKVTVNSSNQFIRDNIIRNIQGIHWGFIVKPSYMKEGEWYVSFRSTKGYQKVDILAEKLKGGGHEYSSAARVIANDGKDAIDIVLDMISKTT